MDTMQFPVQKSRADHICHTGKTGDRLCRGIFIFPGRFAYLHKALLNNSFLTFWQLKFHKYALILAGFLAGWARSAYINESRPGENLHFV